MKSPSSALKRALRTESNVGGRRRVFVFGSANIERGCGAPSRLTFALCSGECTLATWVYLSVLVSRVYSFLAALSILHHQSMIARQRVMLSHHRCDFSLAPSLLVINSQTIRYLPSRKAI